MVHPVGSWAWSVDIKDPLNEKPASGDAFGRATEEDSYDDCLEDMLESVSTWEDTLAYIRDKDGLLHGPLQPGVAARIHMYR
jgi:hypothetical protein